jgi:hypothetical protein
MDYDQVYQSSSRVVPEVDPPLLVALVVGALTCLLMSFLLRKNSPNLCDFVHYTVEIGRLLVSMTKILVPFLPANLFETCAYSPRSLLSRERTLSTHELF